MLFPKAPPQTAPSPALAKDQCYAKTRLSPKGDVELGVSVYEHGLIVGSLALLLAQSFPPWIRSSFFPPGCELLSALHDIGKVCPSFQEKIRRPLPSYTKNSLPELASQIANPDNEKEWGWHGTVSAATLQALGTGKYLDEIVGKHHGNLFYKIPDANAEFFGGPEWQKQRKELADLLMHKFNCTWPQVETKTQANVLAGLTTVADWIGSGPLFDYPNNLKLLFGKALEQAGFLSPSYTKNLSFHDIFGFSPNKMQQSLAQLCTGPGVYLLEAPMGLGKTEAALYAAYLALSQARATGIYFALPTQVTSNKIFDRTTPFLNKILTPNFPQRKAFLLHGKAHLEKTELGEEAEPGKSWFNSLKRSILAPFGVGTLDQALLSAIPDVKHSFVRTYGLLGKVVILDEIHSYDAYTYTIIEKFLDILQELNCTVIILTATLTAQKRKQLLKQSHVSISYPLLSCVKQNVAALNPTPIPEHEQWAEQAFNSEQARTINLEKTSSRQQAVDKALALAHEGQQVLWIENTVQEAQDIYKIFRAKCEFLPCALLHSRFLLKDRKQYEDQWVSIYGKDSNNLRKQTGRILVGTQVLEQSLDIDADYLFTALCPMDMLLQRTGRLWRHDRKDRAPSANCAACVLMPDTSALNLCPKVFGKSGSVYSPYILYRTMECLEKLITIDLPNSIRPLLEKVYAEREENAELASMKQAWLDKAQKSKRLAQVASSGLGQTISDMEERLGTRYSEELSVSVLIVKKAEITEQGLALIFTDGIKIFFPAQLRRSKGEKWRSLAAELEQHTVSVLEYIAPQARLPGKLARILKNYVYLGQEQTPLFRIARCDDCGSLFNYDGSPDNNKYTVSYHNSLGYLATKNQKEEEYG